LRHYLLTRAVYDPAVWPIEANRRRLELLRGVTAASLRAQTERRWRWVVLLHPDDPLLEERQLACQLADVEVIFRYFKPPLGTSAARLAALAYKSGEWREAIADRPQPLLTTRIDDDDAFDRRALKWIRRAGRDLAPSRGRTALILPRGYRVFDGRFSLVTHERNAWVTLHVPAGDSAIVYDFNHKRIARYAEIKLLRPTPAWLWVRHDDTLSRHKVAAKPVSDALQSRFPGVDWSLLA